MLLLAYNLGTHCWQWITIPDLFHSGTRVIDNVMGASRRRPLVQGDDSLEAAYMSRTTIRRCRLLCLLLCCNRAIQGCLICHRVEPPSVAR